MTITAKPGEGRAVDPECGDLYTLVDFDRMVRDQMFIDYDGHGNLATATIVSDSIVKPSKWDMSAAMAAGFTHVEWYNR